MSLSLGLGLGLSRQGGGGGIAADWHVDSLVSSSGDGTSRASAFKTIQEALNASTLAAGDVIAVYAGTYREACTLKKSGSDGSPIVLKGVKGTVIIEGGDLLTGWTACTDQADALGSPEWASMFKAFVPSSIATNQLAYNLRQAGSQMYLPVKGAATGGFGTNDDLQNPRDETKFDTAESTTATTLTDTAGQLSNYVNDADLDNAYVLLHHSANNVLQRKITDFDAATGVITFDDVSTDLGSNTLDKKYAIINAGVDIERAGQWAFKDATEGDGTRKVVCYPLDAGAMDDIAVTARAYGLDVADESYWVIQDITAQGQGGGGLRDGLAFGTYTNNAVAKTGITFRRLAANNTVNWQQAYNQAVISMEDSDNSDLEFDACSTFRTMNMAGLYQNGSNVSIHGCTVTWPGATGIRQHSCTDFLCYDNEITEVHGAHANGMSFYIDDLRGVIAFNKVRSGKGIGITCQAGTNLLFFGNDVQCPVGDVNHRAIENNGTAAHSTETGGIISVINNTCPPAPDQTLTDGSSAITIGETGETTHNAVNNVAHGGVDYALATNHGTNAVKGDVSYNILTGKGSTQTAADSFFTEDQNSYRPTIADVLGDYANAIYLPVSGGPLDGTGKDISTLLSPFREWFPDFDFDRDINGSAVDWSSNPFVGAYKPAVALAFDRAPEAFSFTDRTDIDVATNDVEAGPIQISGLIGQVWAEISSGTADNKELRVLASDGSTVIDDWRSGAALIKSGQYLDVRGDASDSGETETTVTAKVGTVSDTFSITTGEATGGYADLAALATTDGWAALYDVTNPLKRTLSGANITSISEGLGNLPAVAQSTNYPQYSAGEFGSLDGIRQDGTQRGLVTGEAFTALTQPYFVMAVMRDDSSTQAQRDIAKAGSTFEFFTRNVANNPLVASAGTILATTVAKDANAHIVEVLVDGSNSQIWIDGALKTTGAMGAGDFASPLSIGATSTNGGQWNGALGPVLVYDGDPGSTKQSDMRALLSSLTGIAAHSP